MVGVVAWTKLGLGLFTEYLLPTRVFYPDSTPKTSDDDPYPTEMIAEKI